MNVQARTWNVKESRIALLGVVRKSRLAKEVPMRRLFIRLVTAITTVVLTAVATEATAVAGVVLTGAD